MSKEEVSKLFLDYLAEEGYRPSVDPEGDVFFKSEGLPSKLRSMSTTEHTFNLGSSTSGRLMMRKSLRKPLKRRAMLLEEQKWQRSLSATTKRTRLLRLRCS